MKLLFSLILLCPAILAAGYVCRREKSTWKEFLLKAAGWFYGITFMNMMLLYLRGWGGFLFDFISVQFLFKYMLCSIVSVVLYVLAGKAIKTERFHRMIRWLENLVQKEWNIIRTNRASRFYALSAGIVISCAVSFLFCVFAPLDLYFQNKEEFWFDVYTLLPVVLLMFFVFALAGSLLLAVLFYVNQRCYQCVWIAGFVLFLCSYIQGSFLTGNLPPLDGTEFNWADYAAGRTESAVLWCIFLALTIGLFIRLPVKRFYSLAKLACAGIVSMLLITLCMECIIKDGLQDKPDIVVTTKDQFQMSRDKNFIIFVLDSADAGIFTEVLKSNPWYQDVFSDFTYYPDTVGAYSFTSRSVPYILSGEWFENKEPFEEYEENVYKNSRLFAGLEHRGYQSGIYKTSVPVTDRSICRFENILEYDLKVRSYLEFAGLELKLAGFKYAPFALKQFCVVTTEDFNDMREDDLPYPLVQSDNRAFYDSVRSGTVTYTDEKCFKYIHIQGAHVPFVYDRNVETIENGTYEQNLQAGITIASAYLNKLKEAGVYDNSAIIIMADHGFAPGTDGRQDPLLLVKGIGEKHKMQYSDAPISFEDLQTAYERLMDGKTGSAVFDAKEGDERKRRFLWYEYLKEDHMVEYIQKGQASDVESMRPTGRVFDR